MINLIEIYNSIITEEHLYQIDNEFDIYRNPKSISKMFPNSRAISDHKGDLYLLDDGGISRVHGEIANSLKRHGYINYSKWGEEVENIKKLPWQRIKKTNNFKLSTSFPEIQTLSDNDHKTLDKLISLVQKKNPSFKFIKETIY